MLEQSELEQVEPEACHSFLAQAQLRPQGRAQHGGRDHGGAHVHLRLFLLQISVVLSDFLRLFDPQPRQLQSPCLFCPGLHLFSHLLCLLELGYPPPQPHCLALVHKL